MVVQALAVLAALVSCAGIAYATSRYLRVRRDFYPRNAWRGTLLLALGLILSVHAVTAEIDRAIGLPNAARWLENTLIACSGYCADLVHVAMVRGIAASRRQHRWVLAWLVAVIVALALLLWRAHVPELASFALPSPNPWLILYRSVWLSYLTFIIARLIIYNWRFGQITPDPVIRLTTLMMVLAGVFALGVIATTMAEPILPATSPAVYPLRVLLELCVLGMAGSFIFTTLPTWNPRLGGPAVARIVVGVSAYRQLAPLWRAVTGAVPEVVLPAAVPWREVLRHPTDVDLLLQRRVVEILDGWRALLGGEPAEPGEAAGAIAGHLPGSGARTVSSTMHEGMRRKSTLGEQIVEAAHATEERLHSMHAAATQDADRLLAALPAEARPASNGGLRGNREHVVNSSTLLSFQPRTYAEQVRYLELVAREFGGRKKSRRQPHDISGAIRRPRDTIRSRV